VIEPANPHRRQAGNGAMTPSRVTRQGRSNKGDNSRTTDKHVIVQSDQTRTGGTIYSNKDIRPAVRCNAG
jgi:hypothetical protein